MEKSKWFGQPYFGHAFVFAYNLRNWIFGIVLFGKWSSLHVGPFSATWHRPKAEEGRITPAGHNARENAADAPDE